MVRINLIKSFNNIDLVFTSIFDDEILFLIKELSETCVLILSNSKGLFDKYTVVLNVFAKIFSLNGSRINLIFLN